MASRPIGVRIGVNPPNQGNFRSSFELGFRPISEFWCGRGESVTKPARQRQRVPAELRRVDPGPQAVPGHARVCPPVATEIATEKKPRLAHCAASSMPRDTLLN